MFVLLFLLKGIWATTLANEKKLNRAFKVRLCSTFCSEIHCIIVSVQCMNFIQCLLAAGFLDKREVNQNRTCTIMSVSQAQHRQNWIKNSELLAVIHRFPLSLRPNLCVSEHCHLFLPLGNQACYSRLLCTRKWTLSRWLFLSKKLFNFSNSAQIDSKQTYWHSACTNSMCLLHLTRLRTNDITHRQGQVTWVWFKFTERCLQCRVDQKVWSHDFSFDALTLCFSPLLVRTDS